ncbi:MAG TPA: rhodanese-like domain-containing protein, partial [Desulfobacterales bacterium]|nr:rhodanese-like domain-containing protein [Desulfobacterales bacterium]
TSLLKLAGYSNAKSLKFGMTSWHSDFDSWSGNVSNYYFTFLETTENSKPAEGDLEEINTGFENGEDILDARIDAMYTAGFGAYAIDATMVTNNPSNYYIVNYWPNSEYLNPGHIPGAFNYIPGQSLKLSSDLKTLPTDKTIVVYCYTGQTSAFVSAYLGVLGYDVKSLKFGANSMFTGNLPSSNWTTGNIKDYTYE